MKNPIVVDQASNALTQKYDGVIEAVHRQSDGRIEFVRAYEKRGATWSDHTIISREELIKRIQAGKTFILGERKILFGSTFAATEPIRYQNQVLMSGGQSDPALDLADAPII